MGVSVAGLDILIHIGVVGTPVQHTDLLPLIEEGSALLEEIARGKGLAALRPKLLAAVAGDDAGMVMVFKIEHIPRPARKFVLPVGKRLFHAGEGELGGHIVGEETVGTLALELDHHVDLSRLFVNIFQCLFGPDEGRFRKGEAVIMVEHVPLELR